MATPTKMGFPVTDENAIQKKELQELLNLGHTVQIKPRLGIAVVDGFKRFKFTGKL